METIKKRGGEVRHHGRTKGARKERGFGIHFLLRGGE